MQNRSKALPPYRLRLGLPYTGLRLLIWLPEITYQPWVMWIFFSSSFLSIVADKADPKGDRLLVRARRAGDIERVFPDAEVFSIEGADYAYRSWLTRAQVAKTCKEQVESIDYANFKGSITDSEYHDAAMGAWSSMHRYQAKVQNRGNSSDTH